MHPPAAVAPRLVPSPRHNLPDSDTPSPEPSGADGTAGRQGVHSGSKKRCASSSTSSTTSNSVFRRNGDIRRSKGRPRSLTKKGGPGRSCPGLESQPRAERRTELRYLLVGPRLPYATTYKVKPPRDNLLLLHRSGKLRRRETLQRRSNRILGITADSTSHLGLEVL